MTAITVPMVIGVSRARSFVLKQVNLALHGGSGSSVHELFRFCVVGATNTALDFGAYLLLTVPFPFWSRHFLFAAAVSWSLAVASSFVLNSFWTFGHGVGRLYGRRMSRFVAVALAGGAWNLILLAVLIRLGLDDVAAKAVATVAVTVWNFVLQKMWTFGPKAGTFGIKV